MSARGAIGAITLAALLAGCSLAPAYRTPPLPVPPSWPTGEAYMAQREADLPRYDWQSVFGDPRLRGLIERALANNADVQLAIANVAAARAQYRIQRAEQLPEIDATAGFTHREGRSTSGGGTGSGGTGSGGTGTGGTGGGSTGNTFSLQGGVTGYELDLFGRLASLTGAARSRYLASTSAERAARLALVSEVAQAWLTRAADATLLATARATAAGARQSMDIAQKRLNGGIAPRSDVRQAEITLRTAEADVASQTTAVAQAENALRRLVGTEIAPTELSGSIANAGSRLAEVPAGLDSTILLRRPDVLEAEWQLRAANAEIGAARAQLFPRITLTGLVGLASSALTSLFTGGAFAWTAAANASYPIFRGGAGKAQVALSEAQRDAALATYTRAIRTAFSEVADALARRGTIDAQARAVAQGQAAAADNLKLADLRWRGGIDTYLAELTARQALYSADRALANAQLARATNLVDLYRTLGGDPFAGAPAATPSAERP